MFYSQFILAKKGPLGTIWIAAHLERKLKKNQVADTDIGDSVDSILFPDVPIALRLSSHLLLGVVRIYSRKVNYLFHDCSEALLKVKQAFRSTAVDLPPEESTAPYHSITLPETFDLDDFELPDSALLNGNFDDCHVSSREQITLQDTLDGTGYSTSQFGLDERFGDGDASQIGLDLDEELLLDDNLKLRHASGSYGDVHKGEGASDLTQMDIDGPHPGCDDDRNNEASKELSELLCNDRGKQVVSDVQNVNRIDGSYHRSVFNIQTPDLNEVFLPNDDIGGPSRANNIDVDFADADPPPPQFNELANFTSTPIPANCQELPVSNPQEISPDIDLNDDKLDKPIDLEVECAAATNDLVNATSTNPELDNGVQAVSTPTSILEEPKSDSVALQCSGDILPSSNPVNGIPCVHDDSKDAENNGNLLSVDSTDLKLSEVSPVLPSCTSVLIEPVPGSLAPQYSEVTVDTPALVGFESILRTADTSHTGIVWNEANDLPVSNGIQYENITRLSNLDHGRVEEANSCQTINFSSFSSDFHMRSCTSIFNQANLTSPGDMFHAKNPVFSSRDQPCNLGTPMVDQGLHFGGSSVGLQGFPSHITMDTNVGAYQKSNDIQFGHPNCFSSSEFSEPERMLFAPSRNVNLSSDLWQQTTEKGIIESDGSVDRIGNLFGQKRHMVDNAPELQNSITPNMSGILQKKQNNDYMVDNAPELQNSITPNMSGILQKKQNNDYIIPKDDDLLASILVGRRTPALRIGDTPPVPKPPSLKRPRLTQKVVLPKRRKVLLDDTMVLHADAIRQQLINTEDLRRMRRKAPCTCPEIWRIQKSYLEEDIFRESIFTGISEELHSLLTRRYDLVQNMHGQANVQHFSGEGTQEFEVPKSSLSARDDGDKIAVRSAVVTETVDGETCGQIQGALGGEFIDVEGCENAVSVDAQEQLESPFKGPCDSRTGENGNDGLIDGEHNSVNKEFQTSHGIDEVNNNAVPVADLVSFEEFTSADRVAVNDGTSIQVEDPSNAKAASITVEDMGVDIVNTTNLECPQEGQAGVTKDHSDGASVSMLDRFMVEVRPDFQEDSSAVIEHANSSVPDADLVCCEAVMDVEMPAAEVPCGERPNWASSPALPSLEGERIPSAVGENLCMNAEGGLDVESTVELAATRESSDFSSAIDDIDTDFLNVDDDAEYDEETMNDAPNTEEVPSLENSGWSSRTRGVARYLKTMFDQESGRGRKSVAVDHLLAGKTRKEASRMFFETLVLKTRDYIQVEQDKPFDRIVVMPKIKLLKTEF